MHLMALLAFFNPVQVEPDPPKIGKQRYRVRRDDGQVAHQSAYGQKKRPCIRKAVDATAKNRTGDGAHRPPKHTKSYPFHTLMKGVPDAPFIYADRFFSRYSFGVTPRCLRNDRFIWL